MSEKNAYTPPRVWEWNAENGGRFAHINRPTAGATFERELRNIHAYRACGVPTLEPVYFGWRRHGGHRHALLPGRNEDPLAGRRERGLVEELVSTRDHRRLLHLAGDPYRHPHDHPALDA